MRDAHRLSGSLGTFGFGAASELARQLEAGLAAEPVPGSDERRRLLELARDIQAELTCEPSTSRERSASVARSTIAVASADPTMVDALREEAAGRCVDVVAVDRNDPRPASWSVLVVDLEGTDGEAPRAPVAGDPSVPDPRARR